MDNFDITEAPLEQTIKVEVEDDLNDFKEDEKMPDIKEKEYIVPEEVFKKAEEYTEAPVIKKVRKKRTMTPEALEKLAKAREKANETRRKNKELRLKGEKKYPTQVKQDKVKEQQELKRPVVNNITHETKNITNNITHEDIERISVEATKKTLIEYEMIRKKRKEEKKIKKEEDNRKLKITNQINRAMGRPPQNNFVDHYF